MSVRTFGETRDCAGCRYWSEMLAMADGGGPVKAVCLAPAGPRRGQYQSGRATCDAWASGHYGAVDEPGDGGDPYAEDGDA